MLKLTKPPYADTKVDAEKTQQDVTQLLRKYYDRMTGRP